MGILTKEEILKEIGSGRIRIEPFDPASVGPASIDLTLGDSFRIFRARDDVYDVTEESDYKGLSDLVTAESIVVRPHETVLGITRERITLPPSICGWLEGRSRFARLGLMIHISASFMQPGIANRQVLEISNMGSLPLRIHAGTRICQFIFQRTEGEATYQGRFVDQREP